MKKKYVLLMIIIITSSVYSQDDPFELQEDQWIMRNEDDVEYYFEHSQDRLDPYILRTVIINGYTEYLSKFINDMQIGILSANELSLLRNMVFAKYGYIFKNSVYTDYFRNYDWYKPEKRNVDDAFSRREKYLVDKILCFESDNFALIKKENLIGFWEEFNGGADQEGANLNLKSNGEFVYNFQNFDSYRTTKYFGKWDYISNKIVLTVYEQDFIVGGYFHEHPNTPYIENEITAKIIYEDGVSITLPVLISEKPYSEPDWLTFGSSDYYRK